MSNTENKPAVLIFEDDIQLAHEWKEAFKRNGIDSEHSWDVNNAIRLCNQKKFDVIICDVFIKDEAGNLKSEAGVTLVSSMRLQLKDSPKWCRTVPILVVTGSPITLGFDILNVTKSMGTSLSLRKPFSPDDLVKRIQEILKEESLKKTL